jgi:hypothetical protein
MAPDHVDQTLKTAAERGGISTGADGYSITDEGRAFHNRIQGIVNDGLKQMESDAPSMARIRRYLQDLNAWRDDAHVAAWRSQEVSGHEWEVFSHVWGQRVWGDPIGSAAEAAEKLGFRGYDEAGYEAALSGLQGRGWLEQEDGRYRVSEEGARIREAAEVATDEHFFGPWNLNEAEAENLKAGLTALRDAFSEAKD